MTYKRNGVFISVEKIDGLGKNYGLYCGTDDPNEAIKVASFGSDEKAQAFCNWLEYISGYAKDKNKIRWCNNDDT